MEANMKYIGIDLHATNSVIAIVDAQEQVLYCKRHANRLQDIIVLLRSYRDSGCVAAVESTYNWYWLIDGLKAEGFDVRLANSAALPQYRGLKYSDDETDAIRLARLLARGLLPEGYIYPVGERGVRDLLRRRLVLVRTRAQQLIAIDGLLARHLGTSMAGASLKRLDVASLCALPLSKDAALQALAHLRVRETLDGEIAALEKHLADRLTQREDVRLLKTVPGIGSILAATIALEVGDIRRFANAGCFASYCRLVASTRISNGKVKGHGNAKCGNRYLAWAFMEAALFAKRWSREAQSFYRKRSVKRHKLIALKALAHKLARACYHLLKERAPFDPARCFA
jgi:transposase